ncbi:MAG: hypothetical protein WAU77_00835 [Solirubrobacteraceae bacterium]
MYADALRARWKGGPHVLAFLFAQPDSVAIRDLRARVDYFDHRTGDVWDLFFPGYYREESKPTYDDRPVGVTREWFFNPSGFDEIRRHIEDASAGLWRYSGNTDLVLIGCWLSGQMYSSHITIDWQSTLSGELTDREAGVTTLTLGAVVERITRDLEHGIEDGGYGVGQVVNDDPQDPASSITRELIVDTLAGIAAALGARVLGV